MKYLLLVILLISCSFEVKVDVKSGHPVADTSTVPKSHPVYETDMSYTPGVLDFRDPVETGTSVKKGDTIEDQDTHIKYVALRNLAPDEVMSLKNYRPIK